jgi:hypothetical protein
MSERIIGRSELVPQCLIPMGLIPMAAPDRRESGA